MLLGLLPSFAQQNMKSPKLYINITVDQLRTDFLYEFSGLYGEDGFKRLLGGGKVYPNAYYAFENIDRASAVATLATGTNEMSVFTSLYTLTSSQSRPFSCLNTNNENSESAAPKTQVQIRNLINFLEYINLT